MKNFIKFLTDFLPLLVFFFTFKVYGLMPATVVLLVASVIALIAHYLYHKTVPAMLILTTGIVVTMGALTIFSGNTVFVKMKPTVVSLIFSGILFFGLFRRQAYIKKLFDNAIDLSNNDWLILSRRFACLFLFIAILNEVIWRTMSESFWVNFKVFGILGITVLFLVSQLMFMFKNQRK